MMVGLGLPLCSDVVTEPGFVGPINCDPSSGPVSYTSALPLCADIVTPAGFVGPVNCDPSAGPVQYTPATGSTLLPTLSPSGQLLTGVSNQTLILAVAAILALMMLRK